MSPIGLFYGVLASIAVALFAIMTSTGLSVVRGSVWKLTFYNNLNSTILFILGIVVTAEYNELKFLPISPKYVRTYILMKH